MNKLILLIVKLQECFYNYRNIPKASVVVLKKDGKYLSVSRKHDKESIGLPGGKTNYNETFSDAAIREIFEETGFYLYNLKPVFVCKDGDYRCVSYVADFVGEIGQLVLSTTETGFISWVEYENLKTKSPFGKFNTKLEKRLKKLNLI